MPFYGVNLSQVNPVSEESYILRVFRYRRLSEPKDPDEILLCVSMKMQKQLKFLKFVMGQQTSLTIESMTVKCCSVVGLFGGNVSKTNEHYDSGKQHSFWL